MAALRCTGCRSRGCRRRCRCKYIRIPATEFPKYCRSMLLMQEGAFLQLVDLGVQVAGGGVRELEFETTRWFPAVIPLL